MAMIDQTLLTPQAAQAYVEFVKEIAESLQNMDINPSQIPDEEMQELSGGRAEIFVILPDENQTRVSFTLEPGEWMYKRESGA